MRAATWSEAAVRRLRELIDAGVSLSAIAAELGRTVSAVKNKALMQGYRRTGSWTRVDCDDALRE